MPEATTSEGDTSPTKVRPARLGHDDEGRDRGRDGRADALREEGRDAGAR